MRKVLSACGLGGALLFSSVASAAAPQFENVITRVGLRGYQASTGDGHGPGAVFTDLNNDRYPDLYLMRSGAANQLYLNTDQRGRRIFVRALEDAGAGHTGRATGALAADYDNDGDQDLFVLNFDQQNVLLQNRLAQTGQLSFANVTRATDPTPGVADDQFGLATARWEGTSLDKSLTAAWGDPDRDGDLDLFVGNHHQFFGSSGLAPGEVPGQRDIFYRNNGNGTFTDITMSAGVPGFETASGAHRTNQQNFSSSNAAIFADFNNDRWPDLLVTNKVGGPTDRDMLYINAGQDRSGNWRGFRNETYQLPITFGNRSGAAMGVVVGDLQNDGDLDIYITDWSNLDNPADAGRNDLWINRHGRDGTLAFVHSDLYPATYSWGTQWEDFDNDGQLDVHVATQAPARDYYYSSEESGRSQEMAVEAGLGQARQSRGDLAADYNRDGWLDLMVVNLDWWNGPSALYENRSGSLYPDHHFLSIKLHGDPENPAQFTSTRDAIGARVYVTADLNGNEQQDAQETMMREVVSGSSNAASTSSLELEFGLGLAEHAWVEVFWPSGRVSQFFTAADAFLEIEEGTISFLGDFDLDDDVDGDDLRVWLGNFGLTSQATRSRGDSNGDGQVDGRDFLAWQAQVGTDLTAHPTAAVIPEPAGVGLVLVLLVVAGAAGRQFVDLAHE